MGKSIRRLGRWFIICGIAAVSSACGGGGGGGAPAASPPGPPPPPPPPPALQKAVVNTDSTTFFAEQIRLYVLNEILELDASLVALGDISFPQFRLMNGEETNDCAVDGEVTITVAGNGADISITFTDCRDVNNVDTLNGSVRFVYSAVNASQNTFTFTASYLNLSLTTSRGRSSISGIAITDTEITSTGHLHSTAVDIDLTTPTGGRIFTDNLAASAHHIPLTDTVLDLRSISGSVGHSSLGVVDIESLPGNGEFRIVGAQNTASLITLNDELYAAIHTEPSGRIRQIEVPWTKVGELRTQDGIDSPPVVTAMLHYTFGPTVEWELDFREDVFDPDFEFLDYALIVTAGPPGRTFDISQSRDGVFQLAVNHSEAGIYEFALQVTDRAGNLGESRFPVTVRADTDGDGLHDNSDPDDDNDGIPDVDDAFPVDPREQADADADGIGDNADPDDDNDGVIDFHDYFPFDPVCSAPSQGDAGGCFLSNLLDFDAIGADANGIVYLTVFSEKRVYRWDSVSGSFLPPWLMGSNVAGDAVMTAAELAPNHGRLYLGYDDGSITYANLAVGAEQAFADVPARIAGLGEAGDFVFAGQDGRGVLPSVDDWLTHFVFSQNGSLLASADFNRLSDFYEYSPTEGRVYFFRDDQFPNDIHYERIDQATGAFLAEGETPYHGAYAIAPPLVVSPGGDLLMIGTGNFFTTGSLNWAGAMAGGIVDAHWDAAYGLVTIRAIGSLTALQRRGPALQVLEERLYIGRPRALARADGSLLVVTETDTNLLFHRYAPSNDTDRDGIANLLDDFPRDPAAAVDTDRDGYPDNWNPGATETNSTTGLVLDAYPFDSACYLPEHGDGVNCDLTATLPAYRPDVVAADIRGVVYLLSQDNNRVFRYSAVSGQHLPAIIVGTETVLTRTAPMTMAYAPALDRLYLAYESGDITYVEVGTPQLEEVPYASTRLTPAGIAAAGGFLLTLASSNGINGHYFLDAAGDVASTALDVLASPAFAWNETLRRLYFLRENPQPRDIHFAELSPDGEVLGTSDSPYHGTYVISPPIIVSADDQSVLTGSGDIYAAADLTWQGSLDHGFIAGVWGSNGTIITARDLGGTTRIDRYDASQNWQSAEDHSGVPLALTEHADGYLLVTHDGLAPRFTVVPR